MKAHYKKMKEELANCNLMHIFEIPVIDNEGKEDWILCDIKFKKGSLFAFRDAVSSKEERSKFIANTKINVDDCFSLDEHLQELYSAIIEDIINGDLYTLGE